jgi:hypothetical protein
MKPVMSEFNSFPIDPNLDAVSNCLASVKDRADLFILIVGGRYGSETKSGKSVTNLEYLEAKAKGIPRYVFVQKDILTTLPIWQKNQSANFSGIVDSPKLFDFVQSLRDPKENWVFPFETAQDITDTLRKQLAYLFKDALDIRSKVVQAGVSEVLQDLSGTALILAVQKPFAWEHRLFSQTLADEITRASALKRDLDYGIALGRGVRLRDLRQLIEWIQTKMGEIISFVKSAEKIVNVALAKALGAPGEPGDLDEIVYVARRLGQVYRRLLEWSAEFRHVQAEEDFAVILSIVSRASQNAILELEGFSATCQEQIGGAVSRYERTKEPQSLAITLTMTCPDMTDLDEELDRLASRLGID